MVLVDSSVKRRKLRNTATSTSITTTDDTLIDNELISNDSITTTISASNPTIGTTINNATAATNTTSGKIPLCTLIVCPMTLMSQWVLEVQTKIVSENPLSVHMYYSQQDRQVSVADLENTYVIVTSYGVLISEAKEYQKWQQLTANSEINSNKSSNSTKKYKTENNAVYNKGLYGVKWRRIVLDEAHTIKNMHTEAVSRWFLKFYIVLFYIIII